MLDCAIIPMLTFGAESWMTEHVRRSARLLEVERLLRRNPKGLTTTELGRETGYSPRTIQRDIAVLESELGVPIELVGRRYRVMPGSHPLAPVRFTIHEARSLFIATRLFLRYADEWDPDAVAALDKLAEAMPGPVSRHIQSVANELRQRPQDKQRSDILRVITEAWGASETIHIAYRSVALGGTIKETDLDPYLLEPSANGNATYVLGHSHAHGEVRTFKLERIEHVEATGRLFVPRDVREIVDRLAASWGIYLGDDDHHVVLEVEAAVAPRMMESTWHSSQRVQWLGDGRARIEFRLPSLTEFVPWVRSWGPNVTVIQPDELRIDVADSLRAAAALYGA